MSLFILVVPEKVVFVMSFGSWRLVSVVGGSGCSGECCRW